MNIKNIVILVLFLIPVSAFGQQTKEWINNLENPNNEEMVLKKDNLKSKYITYDFSVLLQPKHEVLGYIGDDYRRLKIYFTSISKRKDKQDIYDIKGTSIVGKNKFNFEGEIRVLQIREYNKMHFGCDDEFKGAGFKAQGLLIGEYSLREDAKEKHSGIFEGIMTAFWYVDRFGDLNYDDIEASYSDVYANNQYIGTWTAYGNKVKKISNWGEYRIPFSGNLDLGAAEFSPNPKYKDQGWADYYR